MAARVDHLRGHPIYFEGKIWRYKDNNDPTATTHAQRKCGHCGEAKTKEGHDPCLGTLPNVMNACCGHGRLEETYVQFVDGSILSGYAAAEFIAFKRLGRFEQ